MTVIRLLQPFLHLFLQSPCPLCQRFTSRDLCSGCEQQLRRCQLTSSDPARSPEVFAWGAYTGTLKRTIAVLKYQQCPQLARPLGNWLADAWLADGKTLPVAPIVVPIPIHAERRQQRGFNQADLIARGFCNVTGYPLLSQGLQRHRMTEAQFGLSARDREQNLQSAFSLGSGWSPQFCQRPVLLIDDIYTTGATVRAAIQTLATHQIRVLGVAIVARALSDRSSG